MGPLIFVVVIVLISIVSSAKKRQEPNGEAKKKQSVFEQISDLEEADFSPKKAEPLSHTLKPFTESEHSHMETSITGFEECSETPDEFIMPAESADFEAAPLNFDAENVRNGILYAEILGKPKALRR